MSAGSERERQLRQRVIDLGAQQYRVGLLRKPAWHVISPHTGEQGIALREHLFDAVV
jgi:hypothetical protein